MSSSSPDVVLTATWSELNTTHHKTNVPRSSHTLAVLADHAYIFGGEIIPRIPVDNIIYVYNLTAQHWENPIEPVGDAPSPRVGATSAVLSGFIYVFGGRGVKDMTPLVSDIYQFDPKTRRWSIIRPANESAPVPEPRSFHGMTASETHLYVFAGCPISGRLNDLWSFNPLSRVWTQLAFPDVSARGGPGITYADGKLWLFGGFNGNELDDLRTYSIATDVWSSPTVLTSSRPPARSVHGLVHLGDSRLVTLYGEKDPSLVGHEGAGKFWDDIWVLDIHEGGQKVEWRQVTIDGAAGSGGHVVKPKDRGWFQAVAWKGKVVLSGGLDVDNGRLGDLFVLDVV
ncbi:kelch repeat protein [Jimgerdemannia flammicorona]|uniref:Kelch repeat protein n=1 Tax=Jimgerdemannia flammicorona TaxID=994334 RepID=A0A433DDV2_9FUNG|nr:kelch repeat protein [Jimgerdemannia flammicorona]